MEQYQSDTLEKQRIKIIIPDAGPINTLAAAGLLRLFLAPKNTEIIIIQSVFNEIIVRAPELKSFMDEHMDRISIVKTSVCEDDQARLLRGDPLGKGRGDLAIADFILNYIDESIGNSPALVIYEDKKLGRLHAKDGYTEKTHFITTAAYLKKLEQAHIIESFDLVWQQITEANFSLDPSVNRLPSVEEAESDDSFRFGF